MTQQYEIIDFGLMMSDGFQGISAVGTGFEEATYGIGTTRYEAYANAVEMIYGHLGSWADFLCLPQASELGPDAEVDEEANEDYWWHVGIRYNPPWQEKFVDLRTGQVWIFETRNGVNFLVPQAWPDNATEICAEDDPQAFEEFLETLQPFN